MNRSALKNYAPKARLDFIRAVTDRAAFFGLTPDRTEPIQETGDVVIIGGRAFPRVVAEQRKKLQERINQHGFDQVMEAMAYTWFNRFVALRYMELHGYLDHGYRVLSAPDTENGKHGDTEMPQLSASDRLRVSASSSSASPEILMHAEHVTLPGLDAQQVINLKLDGSREAELYRLLLVAQCNALHEAMPFLFEKIADETELLLPDNLLHSDSIIRKLVNELDEADWQKVEIIGWLYQFYISDKKDEVIGKVVKSEDIPAATQLFTPNWIVKYLVQNTLGRQWLATYPDSPLRQQMEYYIEPAEQTEEVKAQLAAITPKSLDPEKLTLLDPASGSGHILVEAYDLFKAIYQERGYRSKDIPRLILEKNLFGLEIDDRAAQLAAFALLMKARADDRRIFADHVQPNVLAIQESKGLENLLRPDPAAAKSVGELPFADSDLFAQTEKQLTLTKPNQESPLAAVEPCLRELIRLFEHGKTFGSLIRVPPELAAQLPAARQSIEAMIEKGQLWEHRTAALLLPLVRQAEALAKTYDAVVANPPYMGPKAMNEDLKCFAKAYYEEAKPDLYSMFILRGFEFVAVKARMAMVTMQSWMFLTSFKAVRERLLREKTIESMAHLGPRAFGTISGEIVSVTAFCCVNQKCASFKPTFFRLVEGEEDEKQKALAAKANRYAGASQDEFNAIPDSPIAYWVSQRVRSLFKGTLVSHLSITDGQNKTADNDRFLRFNWEVRADSVGRGVKWLPYAKGGPFRRWYGNLDSVVDWSEQARTHYRKSSSCRIVPEYLWYRQGITWSRVTTQLYGFRLLPNDSTFDMVGSSIFLKDNTDLNLLLGLLNSPVAQSLLELLNPTVDLQVKDVRNIPVSDKIDRKRVETLVAELLTASEQDWNENETALGFRQLFLFTSPNLSQTVMATFSKWEHSCSLRAERVKWLEEENNRLWIAAFGLQDELLPDVLETRVTVDRPDQEKYIKRLISYAVGCMMGRYSMGESGLIYAHSRNEGFDASRYLTFSADADGIIPITELAWFPDDATERVVEFIAKAWPREHLEGNLKFIADSLGPNRDEHPRDTIRRYLGTGFYKDHLQTYKKRPIYWLFSSGKQRTFQCLVYLHRYHEGTLARMRTEYVIPLQGKMSHRIEQFAGDITAATSTSHRRRLEKEKEHLVKQSTELAAFDEKLRHYADQRIALDLDDGVKVNYGKFGDLLAEVKAVTGGTEE